MKGTPRSNLGAAPLSRLASANPRRGFPACLGAQADAWVWRAARRGRGVRALAVAEVTLPASVELERCYIDGLPCEGPEA